MNADIFALLVKVTVILGSAALATLLLRRSSAAWRHYAWSAAMTSVIVLVVLQLVVPPIVVRVAEESPLRALAITEIRSSFGAAPRDAGLKLGSVNTSTTTATDKPINSARVVDRTVMPNADTRNASSHATDIATNSAVSSSVNNVNNNGINNPAVRSNVSPASFVLPSASVRDAFLIIWAAGALFFLVRITRSHWHLNRLVRSARELKNGTLLTEVASISATLGVISPVRLMLHPNVNTPCTAGWRNAIIMLPAHFADWSSDRRRAVFTHELAHVVRRDSLSQTIASIVCALFWFHPLCWMGAHMLRSESERAADDMVISAGMPPVSYADHLLAIAGMSASMNRVPRAAVAMARTTQLETRLRAMLNSRQSRRTMTRTTRRISGAAILLTTIPLAGLQARVQDPVRQSAETILPKGPAVATLPGNVATVVNQGSYVRIEKASNNAAPSAATPNVATPVLPNPRLITYNRDSAEVRADTVIQTELAAVPGGELQMTLASGGNVIVHGWDQPTARLRARITGEYWRSTRVLFIPTAKGVELYTMAEVDGARVVTYPTTKAQPFPRFKIVTRGQPYTQMPVTLENEFELWVPNQTNIKFTSYGGDLTLHDIRGTLTGGTKKGTIHGNKSNEGQADSARGRKPQPFGKGGKIKAEKADTTIDKTMAAAKSDVLTIYADVNGEVQFHKSNSSEIRVRAFVPGSFSEMYVSLDRMQTGPQLTISSTFARKSDSFRLRYEVWMPENMQLYVTPTGGPSTYNFDVFGLKGAQTVRDISITGWMDIRCATVAIAHIVAELRGTLTCGAPTYPQSGFVPLKVSVNGVPQIDRIRSTVLGTQATSSVIKQLRSAVPFIQSKADSVVIGAVKVRYGKDR